MIPKAASDMAKKLKKKPAKRVTAKRVQATENKPFDLPNVEFRAEGETEPADDSGLTTRQRKFVMALAGPATSAREAAAMAGYGTDNVKALDATASRLLTYVKVQEALAAALAAKRATPEWCKNRLIELAAASMRNFIKILPDGSMDIDWQRANEAGAIGEVAQVDEEVLKTMGDAKVIKRKIKLFSPIPALQTLLKLSGQLKDEAKIELTGPNGGPVKTETTHKLDYERFADLYLKRTAGGKPARMAGAPENGN